ncbi:MAG: glutaredoxin domain-containing protein [Candidatus Dojkabacteria bacterium]|nr:glutaredoxin domain-containing protein [Candidatus Dojkabacteria bacterium]MDQ7020533.1 glutaredoxin domain-containing protein [Candidatus Dojkabacteria bacterium]
MDRSFSSAGNIVIYSTGWSSDCRRVKMFMDELNVVYQEINIDEDEDAAQEVEGINAGARSVPTIVFSDNSTLTEPSREELISKLVDLGLIEDTSEGKS